jgi:FHS family Na+ dependent glucose MFS transporter 1
MAFTIFVMGMACLFIPVTGSLEILLLAMLISGIASGILDVGCNTLLMWTHGEKSGPFLNGLHFFFGVGSLIAPILLARVLQLTDDIQWLYWIFAIVCLPITVWLWFLPEPKHGITEETKNAPFPVVPVILMAILFFLYVGLELGFGNWIYTYAFTLNLETEISAAFLTAIFWGAFTLGRLLGVWVSTRLRSRTIIFMDLIGCVISIAIVILWRDSSIALRIGTAGLGLSMASVFPTFILLAGERMQITGAITGWFLVGSGLGSMLLPWLIGQIFARTGPQAMTTILLVDLIGILIFLFLFLRTRVEPVPVPATGID